VRFSGCTVHFVRAEMDAGPIVAQAVVPVLPGDDSERLAARILAAEHRLYPLALRLVAEGRAKVVGEAVRILDAGAPAAEAILNPPE
jgi:phosphoribosylglycinamide formyltransferase 1